jgi:hypothetical protein
VDYARGIGLMLSKSEVPAVSKRSDRGLPEADGSSGRNRIRECNRLQQFRRKGSQCVVTDWKCKYIGDNCRMRTKASVCRRKKGCTP